MYDGGDLHTSMIMAKHMVEVLGVNFVCMSLYDVCMSLYGVCMSMYGVCMSMFGVCISMNSVCIPMCGDLRDGPGLGKQACTCP